MNTLELRFSNLGTSGLDFQLMVDSVPFGNANVDFNALLDSILEPVGHFILTCGFNCVPECAGFYDPIFVSHTDALICWEFETRYYPVPSKEENPDSEIVHLEFDRRAYVEEILCKLRKWHSHPSFESLGDYDFSPTDFVIRDQAPPTDPLGGANIRLGYHGEFRAPYGVTEPKTEGRKPRLLPNCGLYRLFDEWAELFEEHCLLDESGEYLDTLPMRMKPSVSPRDCNRAAAALAAQLEEHWRGRARISWEHIDSVVPWMTTRVEILPIAGSADKILKV